MGVWKSLMQIKFGIEEAEPPQFGISYWHCFLSKSFQVVCGLCFGFCCACAFIFAAALSLLFRVIHLHDVAQAGTFFAIPACDFLTCGRMFLCSANDLRDGWFQNLRPGLLVA